MEQLSFNEVIERITNKLSDSDDETITSVYNQLFESPITYIGDDMWEEEIEEHEDIIDEDEDDDEDDDDKGPKKKNSKYDYYDPNDDDNDDE